MSASDQILRVRDSVDNSIVELSGTRDALQKVAYLIGELLRHPEDKQIAIHNPIANVSIIVVLIESSESSAVPTP
jgi:hypothetical protein